MTLREFKTVGAICSAVGRAGHRAWTPRVQKNKPSEKGGALSFLNTERLIQSKKIRVDGVDLVWARGHQANIQAFDVSSGNLSCHRSGVLDVDCNRRRSPRHLAADTNVSSCIIARFLLLIVVERVDTCLFVENASIRPLHTQVLLAIRSTDAIIDTDRFKDRKLTIWHGLKMPRRSKEKFLRDDSFLANKCRACIEAVERPAREAAARALFDANPDSPLPPECSAETSAETLDLVLSFFNSVPEVVGLDSIYKRHIFRELRVMRFARGSTVSFRDISYISLFLRVEQVFVSCI